MIYVNNVTGSASGPGTQANPYNTAFNAAPAAAADDGIIMLMYSGTTYTDTWLIDSVSGTVGQPMVLRSEAGVILAPTSPLRWRGVDNWVIQYLTFDHSNGPGTDNYFVRIGFENNLADLCTNFTIQGNIFRHATWTGLGLETVDGVSVLNNYFYNLRRRQIGVDLGALEMKYTALNVLILGNTFRNIGSDGIEIEEKNGLGNIVDITIRRNHFFCDRPYGVTPDQTYSDNVGENGIDIKRHNNGNGTIIVEDNIFHGFRSTTATQDASGASGEALVLHNDVAPLTQPVIIRRNIFYDNAQGINLNDNTGNGVGAWILDNIFWDNDDWAINIIDSNNYGLRIEGNTIFSNTGNYLRLGGSSPGTTIDSLRNNIFYNNASYGRGTVTGEAAATSYNCWVGNTAGPPTQWVDGTDVNLNPLLDAYGRLGVGSPMIGAGVDVGSTLDFIGQARAVPQSIGAYEPVAAQSPEVVVFDDFRHRLRVGVTDPNSGLWPDFQAANLYDNNAIGLLVNVFDADSIYYLYSFATGRRLRVGFPLYPNSLTMANDNDFSIVSNRLSGSTSCSIRLRYTSGTYRIVVRMDEDLGGVVYASDAFGDIITDAPHFIDCDMRWADSPGANNGHIYLRIDGVLVSSLTGIDNDLDQVNQVYYGAVGGIDAGTGGMNPYFLLGPIIANNTGEPFTPSQIAATMLMWQNLGGVLIK